MRVKEIERSNHLAISVPLILTRDDGVELELAPGDALYGARRGNNRTRYGARPSRTRLSLTDVFATLGRSRDRSFGGEGRI